MLYPLACEAIATRKLKRLKPAVVGTTIALGHRQRNRGKNTNLIINTPQITPPKLNV